MRSTPHTVCVLYITVKPSASPSFLSFIAAPVCDFSQYNFGKVFKHWDSHRLSDSINTVVFQALSLCVWCVLNNVHLYVDD